MLSSGAGSNGSVPNVYVLNVKLAELQSVLPRGINYEVRTGGVANARTIVAGASSNFEAVVYDYEPSFESEFSLNFTSTLRNFAIFSQICHAGGFKAVGYPFSVPVYSASYRALYGWNYGELAATTGVDSLQIQLQGAAHVGSSTWNSSIQTLISQYAEYGLPPSALSVQLTLAAGDPNNISVSVAYSDYEYATEHGVGQVVLWWDGASTTSMLSLLALIRG